MLKYVKYVKIKNILYVKNVLNINLNMLNIYFKYISVESRVIQKYRANPAP